MTRSRRLSGVTVLLLGIACGRLGAPVRSPASQAAQPPQSEAPASEVQAPASPADEEAEEKKQ
jgi:hypothetical protein